MTGAAANAADCQGCGTRTTTAFQCPLCQAEGATDRGFFCTQECFAKNWMTHRNTLHKSGVVREKKKEAAEPTPASEAAIDTSRKGKKRARELAAAEKKSSSETNTAATATAAPAGMTFAPWPALPSAAACAEHGWATVNPPLPLDVPRAVVRPAAAAATTAAAASTPTRKARKSRGAADASASSSAAPADYTWSALLAAAQYTAASLSSDASRRVLVVAGDVYSAHAFAWACRCVGLTGTLQMAVANTTLTASTANDADEAQRTPASYFTAHRRVVIATATVVRAAALHESASSTAVSGAAALWLTGAPAHALLVTLPDVVDPEDLQGVQTRAVFFTGPSGTGEAEEGESGDQEAVTYTYSAVEARYENGTPLQWSPVTMPAPGTSTTTASNGEEEGEANTDAAAAAPAAAVKDARLLRALHEPAARLDDDVCTSLANGDLGGALHGLVRRYQRQPGHFESSLFYALCCNWGAAGLAHAHHRLAYVARFFADHSTRFAAKKNGTLVDAALRAVTAVVRLLPRLRDDVAEETTAAQRTSASSAEGYMPTLASTTRAVAPVAGVSAPTVLEVARLANFYTYLPNLQLQATVCYLYDVASPAVLDAMALAWGLHRYLPGASCLAEVEKARSAAALRVRQRYTSKLDAHNAGFYVTLMHFVYDAVGPYSLTVEEVRRRLLWDLTLAHDAGSLEAFLQCCALLPTTEGKLLPAARKQKVRAAEPPAGASSSSDAVAALSSRQKPQPGGEQRETAQSRTALLRCYAVKTTVAAAAKNYGFIELPYKTFPITGERLRQVERLHRLAVEEVLMAMPRVPRPMYIGDVGNLIGKWAHFNTRFDGVLGATLQVFLETHPDAFRVVGRLVTRRTTGATEPVRIRFDGDEDRDDGHDSDDDEKGNRRRGSDRQLLTGQKGKNGKTSVELPARARKKRAVKEFNKSRFNRNYKSIDASARVPGYVKHAPRRIKGRGKKANKRTVKRGN